MALKLTLKKNLKIVNFLDMTFNLINGSSKSYQKSNDTLLYINKNSNHTPQIIKKNCQKQSTTDYTEILQMQRFFMHQK